jgi:hypothetical protein
MIKRKVILLNFLLIFSFSLITFTTFDNNGKILGNSVVLQTQNHSESIMDFKSSMTISNNQNLTSPKLAIISDYTEETIAILVNSTLYAESLMIQSSVEIYIEDLYMSGYDPILYTLEVSTAFELRTLLQNWYTSFDLSGAVLIGEFPLVYFSYDYEIFISDLYFMDLDGNWENTDQDENFDLHTGDILPEIFISRIDATHRTLGGESNEQNIINYLNRTHAYKTGDLFVSRSNRALSYIDDTWIQWADGTYDNWSAHFINAYPDITSVYNSSSTNGTDWLSRLSQDYEFAKLCAHSDSTTHYFDVDGEIETVENYEIHEIPPQFNFYSLYCCSAADWEVDDCLATTYLFSGPRSLAVISSTKTGGMLGDFDFFNPLMEERSIGEAFYDWFQYIEYYVVDYTFWFYGMVILGDPFVTIDYDCKVLPVDISSSTHPNSDQWYTDQTPHFNWTEPRDLNGISGYYYRFNQNPNSILTSINGNFTVINGTSIETPLSSGTWYIHVGSKDNVGNIADTPTHYQINIDLVEPQISIVNATDGVIIASKDSVLNWTVIDEHSGYSYIEIYVDGNLSKELEAPLTGILIRELYPNQKIIDSTLELVVYDGVGFFSSVEVIINKKSIPSYNLGTLGFIGLIGVIYKLIKIQKSELLIKL